MVGWSNCGADSQGRPIGYSHEAICDHVGCQEKIDRGLSYVCGDMHGEDEFSCERYFCEVHRANCILDEWGAYHYGICDACAKLAAEQDGWTYDPQEDIVRPKIARQPHAPIDVPEKPERD